MLPGTMSTTYVCWTTELSLDLFILSPHRDDAAFSLTLSIAYWLSVGHRVTVLNVFTRSLYAPYSDADTVHENDRLTYVSAMRKKEDESFLRLLPGLAMIDLNLKDAPIRFRCDPDIVCEMDSDSNDTAIPKIRKAIATRIESKRSTVALVVPLAIGHHVDHRVVRDAALSFTTELPAAFYEDLPYAAREGVYADLSGLRDDIHTRLHETLHPVLVHGTHAHSTVFKRKTAILYSSQIDQDMAETIATFSQRYHGPDEHGGERLWANDLWLKQASVHKLCTIQTDEEAAPLP